MNRLLHGLAVFFVVLVVGEFSARAATLADHVPADAVYYLGWKGGDALAGDYDKSNLKGFVDASGIPAWVAERSEWLIKKIKAEQPDAEAPLKLAMSVAGKMWKHPTAVYFGGTAIVEKEEQVRFALICRAGEDAGALVKEVQPMLEKIKAIEKVKRTKLNVWIKQNKDVVVFGLGDFAKGHEPAMLGLDGEKAAVLSDKAEFKSAMAEVDGDAALAMYVDVVRMMDEARRLNNTKEQTAESKEDAERLLGVLKLDGFTQLAASAGFSGKEWVDKSFVGLKGEERKGLATFFAPKAMDEAILKWVPEEASSFQVLRLDATALWDNIREMMKAMPEQLVEFDRTAKKFKQNFGIDLRKDVLAGLDDTLLYYNLPSTDDEAAEAVVLMKLRDEAKLTESLDAFVAKMEEMGAEIGSKKEKLAGVQATIATMDTKSVAWGAYKGWLIVSTPEGFERAVRQIKVGKKSILDNEKFVSARKNLGVTGAAVSVDFHDPAVLYTDFLKNAALLMIAANLAGAELPANFLPEPAKVEKFMTPGAGVTWMDEKGSHCVSRSAMPGMNLMAGQFNGGTLMITAGVGFSAAIVAGSFAEPQAEAAEELP
jgi:hypothetical protein